jgi:hypothetical protein
MTLYRTRMVWEVQPQDIEHPLCHGYRSLPGRLVPGGLGEGGHPGAAVTGHGRA